MAPLPEFVRTDTAEDCVYSLESACRFLESTSSHPLEIKWFIISLHCAVQGALALVLERGNALLVQTPGTTRRLIAALDADLPLPEPYMDNLTNLYSRAKDQAHAQPGVAAFAPSATQDKAIQELDLLRHEFIHFNCKSWSLGSRSVLLVASQCCDVVRALLTRPGAVLWHDARHASRVDLALQTLKARVLSLAH